MQSYPVGGGAYSAPWQWVGDARKATPKWEDPEGMHAKQLPSGRIPQLLQWFYAGKATLPIFPDLEPAESCKPRVGCEKLQI